MKNQDLVYNNFTTKAFLSVAIPSYFFPAIMSWTSGWVLENSALMKASYVSIAIPSLVATILVYLLLQQFYKMQKKPKNRYVRALFITILMAVLSLLIIKLFKLEPYMFDILFSSTLGTIITIWKFPLKQF